jgi:hypothetical protein
MVDAQELGRLFDSMGLNEGSRASQPASRLRGLTTENATDVLVTPRHEP